MSAPSNEDTPTSQCPDAAALAGFLNRSAPDADQRALSAHIESCGRCQRQLDTLAGNPNWLKSLGAADGNVVAAVLGGSSTEAAETAATTSVPNDPELQNLLTNLRGSPPPTPTQDATSLEASESDEITFLTPADQPGYLGKLGPYNIIEVVGRGGFGVVLKAHDPALDRIVAVKVLLPILATSPAARRRFVREARAAAAVSHEHVVTIHAVDEDPASGLPYLVMQFVSGRSLESRIRSTGPLRLEEVLRIAMQTASGLAAAHAQGLVHRDIKPANIMLENGVERVKITDFGLARAADDAGVTLTGHVSGTPNYMAPEQARGERVDHHADLFALGCVMYAMSTGNPPFSASTPLSALRKVCEEQPRPARQINEEVPDWLERIISHLMEKDPALRPQSARDVADLLAARLAEVQYPSQRSPHIALSPSPGTPGEGRGEGASQPPRRHKAVLLAGLLPLALATLALTELKGFTHWTPWARSHPTRPSDPATQPTAPSGPFHVLSASTARSFPTLAEAISAASPGDTIEIREGGVIETPPFDIGAKPLLIRAGEGFRPTLAQARDNQNILTSSAPLVLEGLTFDGAASADALEAPRSGEPADCLVTVEGAPLHALNCRFIVRASRQARFGCIRLSNSRGGAFRNCELHAMAGAAIQWMTPAPQSEIPDLKSSLSLRLENSVSFSRVAVVIDKKSPALVSIDSCSLLVQAFLGFAPTSDVAGLTIDLRRTVLATTGLHFGVGGGRSDADFRAITWQATHTLFDLDRKGADGSPPPATTQPADDQGGVEDDDTPRPERPGAIEARVRFQGEMTPRQRPDAPGPHDFAIQSVRFSTGRQASKRAIAGMGPRLPLVGPGAPYDSIRASSSYGEWRDTAHQALRRP